MLPTAILFTFLLETVTGSGEDFDGYGRAVTEGEAEHSYVQDAQAGLSHVLDELKAFQKRIEHSILHTEKGAFILAGILCSIAMVVLVGGALYCHWFGNYVPKYIRVSRKDGKEITMEAEKEEKNGHMKSE
ncbi:uncharacterized protein LOC124261836 [Haliotis rubra]|uniref:uncharacterized protein LOC124261836 n=1 Tax=Haliotis rubra TaxID=36100 RepID=UPI001EE5CA54|nr:uncharacterized protein LOC124261836 [Haliotis rubra]